MHPLNTLLLGYNEARKHALAKNRSVRLNQGNYVRIDSVEIPDDGLIVELSSI